MPKDTYYNNFISNQEVLDHAGINLVSNNTLLSIIIKEQCHDPDTIGTTKKYLSVSKSKESFDAAAFMCGLNAQRYQGLPDELLNAFLNRRASIQRAMSARTRSSPIGKASLLQNR